MDFKNKLYQIFSYHCCLSNGTCERTGHYIPLDDFLKEDYEINKKFFEEGELFPGDGHWIGVPAEF